MVILRNLFSTSSLSKNTYVPASFAQVCNRSIQPLLRKLEYEVPLVGNIS